MSGLDSEYIKYLIGSQVNYTQSYMGAHHDVLVMTRSIVFARQEVPSPPFMAGGS